MDFDDRQPGYGDDDDTDTVIVDAEDTEDELEPEEDPFAEEEEDPLDEEEDDLDADDDLQE